LQPKLALAKEAVERLPGEIQEKLKRDTAEVLGKVKELGNSFLGLFGLSVDNFKLQQDPSSGSYSVNFQNSAS
jgi:valyl-tRNA synthetase